MLAPIWTYPKETHSRSLNIELEQLPIQDEQHIQDEQPVIELEPAHIQFEQPNDDDDFSQSILSGEWQHQSPFTSEPASPMDNEKDDPTFTPFE